MSMSQEKKAAKIVIIGAGVAGLHFAYLLKENGYKNVVILEQESRIAGKLQSYELNNEVQEFGACYYSPVYRHFMELMDRLNLGESININSNHRHVVIDHEQSQIYSSKQWVMGGHTKQATSLLNLLTILFSKIEIVLAIKKYIRIHRQIFGEYKTNMPPQPKNQDSINMSFLDFLKRNNLTCLIRLFCIVLTTQGYGILSTIPALYGLWWIEPKLLHAYFQYSKQVKNPNVWIQRLVATGFEEFGRALAKASNANIKLNIEINHIERKDNHIIVNYQEDGKHRNDTFDYLISAAPVDHIVPLITQASDFEKEISRSLSYSQLSVGLTHIPRKNNIPGVLYWADRLSTPSLMTSLYAMRNTTFLRNINQSYQHENLITYQYTDIKDDKSNAEIKTMLENELQFFAMSNNFDFSHYKIVKHKTWNYFPKFSISSIAEGLPWKIKDYQGSNHTYYIGSSVCFESVNAVLNYNLWLIEKFNNTKTA